MSRVDALEKKKHTHSATNTRLMRDLSRLMRSDTEKLGFSLQLKNDDALNEWNINLFGFSDCPLADVRCIGTQIIIDSPRVFFLGAAPAVVSAHGQRQSFLCGCGCFSSTPITASECAWCSLVCTHARPTAHAYVLHSFFFVGQDMKRLTKDKKLDHVRLVMKFKDDYPFSPPFVRIVYPRFKRSTGYIIDGAFCMELLTNQVNEKIKK